MKIDEIDITKFGKISNLNLKFNNGINLVEGNNESGKSTIQQFILSSFFGFYKYKRNGIKEFDLWKPWDETIFFGKIKYSLDNEKKYLIERDFNNKKNIVYDEKYKNITNKYLKNKSELEILEEQIDVNEEIFKNVVIGKQNAIILSEEDKNILIHKIINKTSSGNENISFDFINKKLNEKIRDEIGNNQTKAKPINIINNKLLNLYEKKEEYENIARDKIKIDKNISIVKKRFSDSSEKLNLIEKILETKKELLNEKKIIDTLKENFEIKKKDKEEKKLSLKQEYNENLKNIKRKTIEEERLALLEKFEKQKNIQDFDLEKDKKTKSKKIFKYLLLFIISIIILLLFNLIYKRFNLKGLNFEQYLQKINEVKLLKYTNISICVGYVILNIIFLIHDFKNKKKKLIKDIHIEKDEINEKLSDEDNDFIQSQLEYFNNDLEQDRQNILRREDLLNKKEKQIDFIILKEYAPKVDSKYIKSLLDMSENKLISEEGMLKQIYDKSLYSISQLETEKNEIIKKENLNLELDEEIYKNEIRKKELLEEKEVINIAQNILEEANEELKEIIDPNFINIFNKIIMKITNGKYSNLNIEDENEIYAKDNEKNKIVNIKSLSAGTLEQFYLSFRLAVLMNISKEKLPIILDEAFSNYDNIRLKNILKYFQEISKDRQIILFSSNDRERKILENENIKFNYIKI